MGEFQPRSSQPEVETTQVDNKVYTIDQLREYAETIPTTEIPLAELAGVVGEGHTYWIDRNGEQLGPYHILADWSAAQNNEAWRDHVESIQRANFDNPIWMTSDGAVFDGMHRLTKAFIDGKDSIKVKVFETLPPELTS